MDDAERDHAPTRLRLIDLYVTVLDHRQEVLELIASAATPDEAEARISARFGPSESYMGQAVLNLQFSRLTMSERAEIEAQASGIRAALEHRGWAAGVDGPRLAPPLE